MALVCLILAIFFFSEKGACAVAPARNGCAYVDGLEACMRFRARVHMREWMRTSKIGLHVRQGYFQSKKKTKNESNHPKIDSAAAALPATRRTQKKGVYTCLPAKKAFNTKKERGTSSRHCLVTKRKERRVSSSSSRSRLPSFRCARPSSTTMPAPRHSTSSPRFVLDKKKNLLSPFASRLSMHWTQESSSGGHMLQRLALFLEC